MEIIKLAGAHSTSKSAEDLVQRVCANLGLNSKLLELKSLPGGRHWHLRSAGVAGTLEATWNPRTAELSLKVRADRDGPWIGAAIEEFRALCAHASQ